MAANAFGAFGTFTSERLENAEGNEGGVTGAIGVKRYDCFRSDMATLSHAWTERTFLEAITEVCEDETESTTNLFFFPVSFARLFCPSLFIGFLDET